MGDGSTSPGVSRTPAGSAADPGLARSRVRRGVARLLVRGADATSRWVARLTGEDPTDSRVDLSEAQIRALVARSAVLDREGRRVIDDVIVAGGRHVRELMVPRTEVAFLDAGLSVERAEAVVRATGHSRFPVTDATHDDVIGFVHLRDLLLRPDPDPATRVGELARDVKRLPGSKRVLAALSEMRREGHHLAVVVDEYGGTAGIVTLEDLIEEVVGEIHDEYDAIPDPVLPNGVGPSEVEGLLNLNDFAERTGLALPPGPYETVGGFLMASLGRLPRLGDEIAVNAPNASWRLMVSEMDGRRVARVALTTQPVASALPAASQRADEPAPCGEPTPFGDSAPFGELAPVGQPAVQLPGVSGPG